MPFHLTFMFRTLRASFSMRAQNETWQHIKTSMIEAGITFPLQSKDYLKFMTALEAASAALPYATWTRVDYSEPHMLVALYTNIECELGIDLKQVSQIAIAQAEVLDSQD